MSDKTKQPNTQESKVPSEHQTPSPAKTPQKEGDSKPASQNPQPAVVQPDPNAGKGSWFVVHTYSGHENKASAALNQRVDAMHLATKLLEVVIPTRNIVTVKHGKKEEIKEKIFPGYILVRMDLDDESWLAVRTTPGVTAFVGTGNKPTPISQKEVQAIMAFMKVAAPTFKAKFSVGEAVKIVDGPFADFLGSVETIDEAHGKVKVLVSIFGRETPVELDFLQVSKL